LTPNIDILTTGEHIDLMPADPRLSQVTVEKMPASNNIRENNRRLWQHLVVWNNPAASFTPTSPMAMGYVRPPVTDVPFTTLTVQMPKSSPNNIGR